MSASPQQPEKVPRVQGVSSRGRPTARFLDLGVSSAYDTFSRHGEQMALGEASSSSALDQGGCAVHTQIRPEAPRVGLSPVAEVDLDVVLDVFCA